MDRIARFIVGHSRQVLAATAVISLLAVAMLFRDGLQRRRGVVRAGGQRYRRNLQRPAGDKYATADPINVVAGLEEGSFRTKEGLGKLVLLRDQLAAVDGVVEAVASIVPDRNPITGAPL